MKKVTQWFVEKPAHVGVYQTQWGRDFGGPFYQYWDGKQWGCWGFSPKEAMKWKSAPSFVQDASWRGIATKP